MIRPATLLYPQELIQVTTNRIRRRLRKIHRLVKQGVIMAPSDARLRGEEAIEEEGKAYVARLNGYLHRHGLKPLSGDELALVNPLKDSKLVWGQIVNDMFGV